MAEAKHAAAEPMNEALEQHYKDRIKQLEECNRLTEENLNDAMLKISRLEFDIEMYKKHIAVLEKAFLNTAIEAATAKEGVVSI